MIVSTNDIQVPSTEKQIPAFLAQPAAKGTYPGIILFSDIFQLTASMRRAVVRFAGYGFVVVAPEIYHRFDTRGTHDFGDRDGAHKLSLNVRMRDVDDDVRSLVAFAAAHPAIGGKALHATGFCIGGHIAVRAAFDGAIASAVSFYPTGLHNGQLGGDSDVDTLDRCGEVKGDLLIVFGSSDDNVPVEGRRAIEGRLRERNARYLMTEYDGRHAFMRDEGPRYNPSETDRAVLQAVQFFNQHS